MPIEHDFAVTVLSQDEFHEIDRTVMRHAFNIQNELGRFYNEEVYQNELVFRLINEGIPVVSEGLIHVQHQDFLKRYYFDVLAGNGALCELKAVDALAGPHEKQLLHYLFLLGLKHGKLINFSSTSVEYRFISTNLTNADRYVFNLNDSLFERIAPEDQLVYEILHALLADWGAFLEVTLYEEALVHFLGGAVERIRPLDVLIENRVVGAQNACLLQENTMLHVSAIVKNSVSYQRYLKRMFSHTCLTRIQWVNFNRDNIEMITLKK